LLVENCEDEIEHKPPLAGAWTELEPPKTGVEHSFCLEATAFRLRDWVDVMLLVKRWLAALDASPPFSRPDDRPSEHVLRCRDVPVLFNADG